MKVLLRHENASEKYGNNNFKVKKIIQGKMKRKLNILGNWVITK